MAWRLGPERLRDLTGGWGGVSGSQQRPVDAPGARPGQASAAATSAGTATNERSAGAPGAGVAASAGLAQASTDSASTARPSSGLGDLLARRALASDRATAFRLLLAAWDVPADAAAEPTCEQSAKQGLRCLFKTGTWYTLRRFDMPAMLELLPPDGTKHYATVVALDRDTATLAFGSERRSVPFGEIDRMWDGQFVMLWRSPGLRNVPLAPGMRGRDVEWLRQRLSDLDGRPIAAAEREVFDEPLRERVVAFQTSRSLIPDGIVGEETLTRLVAATRPDGTPRLTPAATAR
jgi:general secretion pathway protein A